MRKGILIAAVIMLISITSSAAVIDFETGNDFMLGVEDVVFAGDQAGSLSSGNAVLYGYHYTSPWDYWGGFVISNRTVTAPADIYHQFTSAPETDHTTEAGGTYAIGFDDWESGYGCLMNFKDTQDVAGAYFANNKWTSEYIAENYGADDYYRLVVTSYDSQMNQIGNSIVEMTNVSNWQFFGLDFQNVHALGFRMESSDTWTPFYFCIDDISTAIPEPSFVAVFAIGIAALAAKRRLKR